MEHDVADSLDIISGIICGVYKASTGPKPRNTTLKYLTNKSDMQTIAELAKQTCQWGKGKAKYILHILLWKLKKINRKDIVLQDEMSDEDIALLKDTIAIIKNYDKPDKELADQSSENYRIQNTNKKLSPSERQKNNIGRFSACIESKVAENWDDVIAELIVWEKLLDGFKRDKKHIAKRKSYRRTEKQARKTQKAYYYANQGKITAQKREYGKANKNKISAAKQDAYRENPTPVRERNARYKDAHREEILATNRDYRKRMQQEAAAALDVCAAYVFLINLKTNKATRKEYSKLYPGKQNPLTHMKKTCVALEQMNINMCPFYNPESDKNIKTDCGKVLGLPNALEEIQAIANNFKANIINTCVR